MPAKTVLFVIASLEHSGAARQLCLLASGLARQSFAARVIVVGTATPWVEALRGQGIAVEVLHWRRPFDVWPLAALRRLLRSAPEDVLHVWGATALRAVVLTGSQHTSRLLVSAVLSSVHRANVLDRWLLRRVGGAIALGAVDAERYRRLGVDPARITIAAPAMPLSVSTSAAALFEDIDAAQRVLLCLGPMERHKGFREAVWTFDILAHVHDDIRLVLAGGGADRARVEQFARQLGLRRIVHFVGVVADTAPLLQRADIVWVPSLRGGGVCAALEAMAAGRPVVASDLPELAEIVADGVSGFLVQPNDKAALARQTRLLLDDARLRRTMGEAGRRRVGEHFSVLRLVETCARRYAGETQFV